MSNHDLQRISIRHTAPVHLPGATPKGEVDGSEELTVTIVLRRGQPSPEMAQTINRIQSQMPLDRPQLSVDEIEHAFCATPEDVEAVKTFAKRTGLKIVGESKGRHDIVVRGPADAFSDAFGVKLRYFQYPGGTYRAHTGDITVPEDLQDKLEAVLGLDDIPKFESHCSAGIPREKEIKTHHESHPFVGTARDFAEYYNFPLRLDGTGQRIAIITFGGGFHRHDLQTYFDRVLRTAPPNVHIIEIDDGSGPVRNSPTPMAKLGRFIEYWNDDSLTLNDIRKLEDCPTCIHRMLATFETTMDIEIVGSIAPGANIDVYFVRSTMQGWLAALNQALGFAGPPDGVPATVISVSWGNVEARATAQERSQIDDVLKRAMMSGVTVCCSSGNFGSTGDWGEYGKQANVVFPASSPWALGCGGTFLARDQKHESVWNSCNKGVPMASGGGVSGFFKRPYYQVTAQVPAHCDLYQLDQIVRKRAGQDSTQTAAELLAAISNKRAWLYHEQREVSRTDDDRVQWWVGRGVPDVAASAMGYQLTVGGHTTTGGGTSAASPLWAALIALLNQGLSLASNKAARLGFINSVIYSNERATGLRGITVGNNILSQDTAEAVFFQANSDGWDACTGLGVPDGRELLRFFGGTEPQTENESHFSV